MGFEFEFDSELWIWIGALFCFVFYDDDIKQRTIKKSLGFNLNIFFNWFFHFFTTIEHKSASELV